MDGRYSKISIIMPALNEAQYLDYVLDSIDNLDYPKEKIEIILVDNGSRDETVSIARKRGAIVLEAPDAKIGQLRNLGVERSTGNILAFLDSDCIVDPQWLKNAIPHLMQENVGAVGCHTRIPKHATWIEKTLDFHAHRAGVCQVDYLPSANIFFRREVFERLGGFSKEMVTGEDSDLCHRIELSKMKLISDDKIVVVHLNYPDTVTKLFNKAIWHSLEFGRLFFLTGFKFEYFLAILVPILYLGLLLIALILFIEGFLKQIPSLFLLGIGSILLVPMAIAIRKAHKKGFYGNVFQSTGFYIIILIARIYSIGMVIMKLGLAFFKNARLALSRKMFLF